MRTSAAGSNRRTRLRLRGFTLLELLVVVSIIAISTAGVSLALRDSSETQLEREAARLAALLESARARSITTGVAVYWRSVPGGFRFDGLPSETLPQHWLHAETAVASQTVLELGPEPVIPRQAVLLGSTSQPGLQWQVATDGLRPFQVQAMRTGAAP